MVSSDFFHFPSPKSFPNGLREFEEASDKRSLGFLVPHVGPRRPPLPPAMAGGAASPSSHHLRHHPPPRRWRGSSVPLFTIFISLVLRFFFGLFHWSFRAYRCVQSSYLGCLEMWKRGSLSTFYAGFLDMRRPRWITRESSRWGLPFLPLLILLWLPKMRFRLSPNLSFLGLSFL